VSRGDVLGLAAVSHAADPEAIARALGLTPAEVAAILFPVVATEDVDGAPRWVVTLAVRRRVLAWDRGADGALVATGQPAVARWVALAGPARGPTETLLRAWLAGRLTDVPQQVRKRPDELRRVATWLADCAWVTPPPREILARLAVEELRRRCHDVASASFVGRDDVLGWMRDRLAHPPRTVVIEGGGGLGKSALLATFVLGAGAYQPGGPIALFLDFDDPVRTVARPDLLHAELARQAAIQAPALDGIARELAATAASNSRAAREDDGPPDEAIARDGRAASLADYLFAELERVGRPSYLVVDTLERARHAAPALLEERLVFWRNQVASRPGQHLIVAGRGPPRPGGAGGRPALALAPAGARRGGQAPGRAPEGAGRAAGAAPPDPRSPRPRWHDPAQPAAVCARGGHPHSRRGRRRAPRSRAARGPGRRLSPAAHHRSPAVGPAGRGRAPGDPPAGHHAGGAGRDRGPAGDAAHRRSARGRAPVR
jgi:hypothetical protein